MDSPRSDKIENRSSSSVSDLDDHRFQPSSLPRADCISNRQHGAARAQRETVPPQTGTEKLHLQWDNQEGHASRQQAPLMASFTSERPLVEDRNDEVSSTGSMRAPQVDGTGETVQVDDKMPSQHPTLRRGRAASHASQSSSIPNSVDAFADMGRRDRANTIDSKAPSDLELRVHRTISGGTHRRRPTFGEEKAEPPEPAVLMGSKRESVEADVCFPPPVEEVSDEHVIDFEALEDFVAQTRRATQDPSPTQPLPAVEHHLNQVAHRLSAHQGALDNKTARKPVSNGHADLGVSSTGKDPDSYSLKPLSVTAVPKVADANRFSFFSSELDATIHASEMGDLVMSGESFRDLFSLNPEGGVWWLDVLHPTADEFAVLSKAFALHPLTSEDITMQENREKVELFRQYYFVSFRSFSQMDKTSEEYMEPLNVYIVVFRKGVLSFTFKPSPHAASVRRRIGKLRDYVALSSDWVCYALM